MQTLQDELEKEPALAVKLLVKVEDSDLPECASACEHFIAKSFQRLPLADLKSISQAACLRILRGVAQQRDAAIDKLAPYYLNNANVFAVPGADTMLEWRWRMHIHSPDQSGKDASLPGCSHLCCPSTGQTEEPFAGRPRIMPHMLLVHHLAQGGLVVVGWPTISRGIVGINQWNTIGGHPSVVLWLDLRLRTFKTILMNGTFLTL